MDFKRRLSTSAGKFVPRSVAGLDLQFGASPTDTFAIFATPSGSPVDTAAQAEITRRCTRSIGALVIFRFSDINVNDVTLGWLDGQATGPLAPSARVHCEVAHDNNVTAGFAPGTSLTNEELDLQKSVAYCRAVAWGLRAVGVNALNDIGNPQGA